jgi:endonuclease YncB( thermonuclease family)
MGHSSSTIGRVLGVLVGCACVAALPVLGGSPEGGKAITGKCIKVVDGDTIVVDCGAKQMTVDLAGIDAPELEQDFGREARAFVRDLTKGQEVAVQLLEGPDGEPVARVSVNGRDLSETLASVGLAWACEEGGGDPELKALCDRARQAHCGLWTENNPTPPWEFRAARS